MNFNVTNAIQSSTSTSEARKKGKNYFVHLVRAILSIRYFPYLGCQQGTVAIALPVIVPVVVALVPPLPAPDADNLLIPEYFHINGNLL